MKNRRPKLRRTVVLLGPEAIALNIVGRIINELKITGYEPFSQIKIKVDEDDLGLFYRGRNRFYSEAVRNRFLGEEVMFLIYVGSDIVRRMRHIVGIQHDPDDWTINTVNGRLKAEYPLRTVTSDSDKKTGKEKKYHYRFVDCPVTPTAAKKQLKELFRCYRVE